jgi:superfamily II DNA or RNA helicase
MAVCSDDSVGKMKEADSTVATVYEAGIPTTTDPTEIVNFIQKKSKNPKVFLQLIKAAQNSLTHAKKQGLTIDLLIADEAHKTVGRKDKKFATLLSDENIKIKQRMFMTATERVYRQGSENIASMDDESVYGKIFHQMSFKQAIDDGIICDYKILTVAVSGSEVANLMAEHTEVTAQLGNQKVETDAHNLAAGIAIEKVFDKHKIKHALSFHRSIKRAEDFNKQQDAFSGKLGSKLLIENRNISSRLSAGQRSQLLNDFTASERSLISNARCLTEGVDIPSIDCVAFVDPKQSTVDIVQAAGRAMRQSKATGKSHGYILIPIIVPEGQALDQFAESTDFAAVARVITSLSTQDERIVEELRNREPGQPPNPDDIIIVDPDIIEALDVDYETFNDAVSTRIWASVGRANFISYMEAREQIRSLGIRSETEWRGRNQNDPLLYNIPKAPNHFYLGKGWVSWQHFLSKKIVDHYDFAVAREKSQAMKCVSVAEWKRKTSNIEEFPTNPERVYFTNGWNGWSDFLGTSIIATNDRQYLTFEECRQFMIDKKIETKAQFDEQKAGFPINIPRAPQHTYSETGFKNWPHFLSQNDTDFLNYNEAKTLIQPMCLKSANEYREKFSKRALPDRLPSNPSQKYKNKGWESWEEFLGKATFLSYSKAKQKLKVYKLTSLARYRELIEEGILNDAEFPRSPQKVYKKQWTGSKDYLGNHARYAWKPFLEARKWVHEQKVRDQKGWYELCKNQSFPEDIPKSPWIAYSEEGWVNLKDWLGNE